MNFFIRKYFSHNSVKLTKNYLSILKTKYNQYNYNNKYDLLHITQSELKKILFEKQEEIPKPLYINPLTNKITLFNTNIAISKSYTKLGKFGLIANILFLYSIYSNYIPDLFLMLPLIHTLTIYVATKNTELESENIVKELNLIKKNTIEIVFFDNRVELCNVKDFNFNCDSLEKVSKTKKSNSCKKCTIAFKKEDDELFLIVETIDSNYNSFIPNVIDIDMLKYLRMEEVESFDHWKH
jgi:hypothetical protein